MDGPGSSARAVGTKLLDGLNRAILARDIDAACAFFMLPNLAETFEGRRIIETESKLRDMISGAFAHYEAVGATDIVRNVLAAEYLSSGQISMASETRVLRGTDLAQAPYVIYSKAVEVDGEWRICESIYVVDDAPIYTRSITYGFSRAQRDAKDSDRQPL